MDRVGYEFITHTNRKKIVYFISNAETIFPNTICRWPEMGVHSLVGQASLSSSTSSAAESDVAILAVDIEASPFSIL